jgi:hypothetical protein
MGTQPMFKPEFGALPPADPDAGAAPLQPLEHDDATLPRPDALPQSVRDQLARELADIEIATAALRRAEPELESWTALPIASAGQPRPVWLIIGVLWLSTALLTPGAVVAIATLAG